MSNFIKNSQLNQVVTKNTDLVTSNELPLQSEKDMAWMTTLNHAEQQRLASVTNDEFITAIFGNEFNSKYPLVCSKLGDPDSGGWVAKKYPCDTTDQNLNWYFLPALFKPDLNGVFRAKKEFATSIYVVMVDDVGTKVSKEKFDNCPPSWVIETSPKNFQYGFIFLEPITDIKQAEQLKEKLIFSGLCDSGATGATARWMRLPAAINGRPKYGIQSPKCKLVEWHPDLKYTIDEIESKLSLVLSKEISAKKITKKNTISHETLQLNENINLIIEALKNRGMYKKPLGSGKHDITCPWLEQHTDALDSGAAYFEPSEQFPTGGFKCQHSHGHLFHIHELKNFLGLSESKTIEKIQILPKKLPTSLRPVPKLDTNFLPNAVKGAVIDLAERLQCPPDYLAVSMLCSAGAVIGNKVGIFPYANDESWEVYPALWGGIVGDPGSKKTPSLQAALMPLQHLEKIASQKFAQEFQAYEQANREYEKELADWNKSKNKKIGFKPIAPALPKRERLVVHDSTYQALGVILSENSRGILALADELSGLLQSLDTAGQEAARGFYLSGWSGTGNYSFDRIGRGAISLPRYCLSVFGGFQPDRIKAYVQFSQRGSSKNDGLLQRFQLIVWPDQVATFRLVDRKPDKTLIDTYFKSIVGLQSLAGKEISGAVDLPNGSKLLHFDSDAQNLFNDWFVKNEMMLTKGTLDSARQSHFAKYRSLIPALALIFHLIDGHRGAVCKDCLCSAISFAKYLKKHADRIYASVSGYDLVAVRLLAQRLLDGKLKNEFTCRTLKLTGWSGLSTYEQAQAAIDVLIEYGWLLETEVRTSGRPSTKYYLNPKVTEELL